MSSSSEGITLEIPSKQSEQSNQGSNSVVLTRNLKYKAINPINDRLLMRYASRILEDLLPQIERTIGSPIL